MATYADWSGLETGTSAELQGLTSGTIQTTVKRSGNYAIENPDAGSMPHLGYDTSRSAGGGGCQIAFRFTAAPSTAAAPIAIYDSVPNVQAYAQLRTDRKLDLYLVGAASNPTTGTTVLAVDTWYVIELHFLPATSGNAVATLYVDGVQEAQRSDGSSTANPQLMAFGPGAGLGGSVTHYCDDIAVYAGAAAQSQGRVHPCRPNATGAETGATGSWADIDDVPTNDATGRTESDVGFLDNVTDTSTFDVSVGSIRKGKVSGRASRSNGSGRTHHLTSLKSGSSRQDSLDLGLSNAVSFYQFRQSDQPTSAAEVDSWQVGMKQSSTGGRQFTITEEWFMVLYEPGAAPSTAIRDIIGRGVVPFAR